MKQTPGRDPHARGDWLVVSQVLPVGLPPGRCRPRRLRRGGRARGAPADGPGARTAGRPGDDQAPCRGRGAPAPDVLPHVPGYGDHGVPVEWGDARRGTRLRRRRSSTTGRQTPQRSTRSSASSSEMPVASARRSTAVVRHQSGLRGPRRCLSVMLSSSCAGEHGVAARQVPRAAKTPKSLRLVRRTRPRVYELERMLILLGAAMSGFDRSLGGDHRRFVQSGLNQFAGSFLSRMKSSTSRARRDAVGATEPPANTRSGAPRPAARCAARLRARAQRQSSAATSPW